MSTSMLSLKALFIQSCTLSFILHTEKKRDHLCKFCIKWLLAKYPEQWKTKKLSDQKVVTVAYEKWSSTSVEVLNCSALTGKVMVVWMGGRTWRFNCS